MWVPSHIHLWYVIISNKMDEKRKGTERTLGDQDEFPPFWLNRKADVFLLEHP